MHLFRMHLFWMHLFWMHHRRLAAFAQRPPADRAD